MRRFACGLLATGAFLFQGHFAAAQSTLDALQQELTEAKLHHQDVASQVLSNFFSQIDAAMASPDAAISLYQQAGGTLPEPAPVITTHTEETATEKAARQAIDQANLARLGAVLQLHCGLMHFAALFVVKPDQKGLQNDWVAWLKTVPPIYLQLVMPPSTAATTADNPDPNADTNNGERKRRGQGGPGGGGPRTPAVPFNPDNLKALAMVDSLISKYLAFNVWGEKEQGKWAVKDLPKLYRTNVLDPLRTPPTDATLAAWDAYISLANADERDDTTWSKVIYPPLQFDRASDDYAISPSTEKLEVLVNLIKANPTDPNADSWIARVGKLMDDYRASHGGSPAIAQNPTPTTPAPPADPNVTVTTQQDGDATIIITHTNSAPVNPQGTQ